MSQKGKSILSRIKAKLSGRSNDSQQYSRDIPQGNGGANDSLNVHSANVGRNNAGNRPTTAGTDRRQNISTPAKRTATRQNDLRIVNNDLGRDELGAGTAAPTPLPPKITNGLHGPNKERLSTDSFGNHGHSTNRRRSDTADSKSIPRKPLRSSQGNMARPDGMAMQDGPRPDSMAMPGKGVRESVGSESMPIRVRASRASVESESMPMSEESEGAEGTQKLIPRPDFGKSDFADFDLTDTVDTDHHTYQAPAVTHDVVVPHVHEIIHKEIHRDIHNHEYRNYIQPIFEQEFLPARHFVPDEQGNLREVFAKDLEGIPGCSGATTDYSFQGKPSLDGYNHNESDRLIGQTA